MLAKKIRVSSFRIFMSGSNLLTFDHLKKINIDPEYSGATNGAYSPQNKFYAIGLNVIF